MSDIAKDIGTIWSRLFDHKGFLSGEIYLLLQDFEQKRGDTEVDCLFKIIENITDIKDTEIDKLKVAINEVLPETTKELEESLNIANHISNIESNYKQCSDLETAKEQRKLDWEGFMDYITASYSEINSLKEAEEAKLEKIYIELQKKLHV